jgi:NADH dehydrogenase
MVEVTGVDLDAHHIRTGDGSISYDYLILATGSQPNFFGLDSVMQVAYSLGGLHDAISLRNHLLTCLEQAVKEISEQQRRAMLTFTIVGGGPTGVELAGALAEMKQHALPRDYPDIHPDEMRIILIEMLETVLPPFDESLQTYSLETLSVMGVEILLNRTVENADCDFVYLKGGDTIPTRTVIWTAGVHSALSEALPLEPERGGRIPVNETLQLPRHPNVYVSGDIAYLIDPDGEPYPRLASVAMQQGERAARNILRSIAGEAQKPFKYHNKGTLATIGRSAAAAQVYGRKITGFIAWFIWLVVHINYLVGFRNRLQVLINWAFNYLKYDPAVRLIVGVRKECESENETLHPIHAQDAGE